MSDHDVGWLVYRSIEKFDNIFLIKLIVELIPDFKNKHLFYPGIVIHCLDTDKKK